MAMPRDLVLVRHGESEANIVQRLFKADPYASAPEGFADRHDAQIRLTALGKAQSIATGEWLKDHFPEGFDKYYVSPLIRAQETAGMLAVSDRWYIEDHLRERDYGELSALNHADRMKHFPFSIRLKAQQGWYWCPPGGESLATGVRLRFETALQEMTKVEEEPRVLAVTHGETMSVARYILEHMTPDEFVVNALDESRKIGNCQVLHYTRINPETQELASDMGWMRSVTPYDRSKDWNSGDWLEIPPLRTWSSAELLGRVVLHPNIFATDEP